MLRKLNVFVLAMALILVFAATASADPGKPNFSASVYADGEAYGTKGTTSLPGPNGNNDQSFDKIFAITNGVDGQLPVAEAAPGNPNYNGGRWSLLTATWIDDLPHPKVLLTSYEDVMFHYNLGHLVIADAETYFQCPLLPTK